MIIKMTMSNNVYNSCHADNDRPGEKRWKESPPFS